MKQDSKPAMSNTVDKHTPGNIFLDIGDFDRTGEPNEIFIRATVEGEIFDICGFGCNETNFAKDYATALVTSFNQAPTLKKENEELKKLLHDLTPGGSEFYNDPQYCAKWIRESREENHYTLANIIKDLKERNRVLVEALEGLPFFLNNAADSLEFQANKIGNTNVLTPKLKWYADKIKALQSNQ